MKERDWRKGEVDGERGKWVREKKEQGKRERESEREAAGTSHKASQYTIIIESLYIIKPVCGCFSE